MRHLVNLNRVHRNEIVFVLSSSEQPLYLPDEDDEFERMFLTWMNEFNVTYSVKAGTLLGGMNE